jgi:hypothetical protein
MPARAPPRRPSSSSAAADSTSSAVSVGDASVGVGVGVGVVAEVITESLSVSAIPPPVVTDDTPAENNSA